MQEGSIPGLPDEPEGEISWGMKGRSKHLCRLIFGGRDNERKVGQAMLLVVQAGSELRSQQSPFQPQPPKDLESEAHVQIVACS